MSDASELWDDNEVDWQELSLAVQEPVASEALTAPVEPSTPGGSNGPGVTLVTEPTLVAESSFLSAPIITGSTTLLGTGTVVATASTSRSEERTQDEQERSSSGHNLSHSSFSVAESRKTSMSNEEKESRKRSIQAAFEGLSSDDDLPPKSTKRQRQGSPTECKPDNDSEDITPSQGVKIRSALSAYDDDLSCPICLELFLSPQLLNPCGHSVCGDCVLLWVEKNPSHVTCPTCRANLVQGSIYIPNFAIETTVNKHIEVLRSNKVEDWMDGGGKWKEREIRKKTYQIMKATRPEPVRNARSHRSHSRNLERVIFVPVPTDYYRPLRRPAQQQRARQGEGGGTHSSPVQIIDSDDEEEDEDSDD
ncbi:hypothetical protein PIIN_00788 [Serendipita indica DSM 11827]|uniref:RING-type domain-containing protein n=1 Tax=Serendipita indica (strain DSM 11827) TaxID=1109443 RepID=G4T6G3_SERID|nr:hypothetical protein PIIN_00788 [Serendipita indica DSM 11827]